MQNRTNLVGARITAVVVGAFVPLVITGNLGAEDSLGVPVEPALAVGFQDVDSNHHSGCADTVLSQSVLPQVLAQDGSYAPTIERCIQFDYFANGSSTEWLDAVALRFDLTDFEDGNAVAAAWLRLYIQRGDYFAFKCGTTGCVDNHYWKLYEGLFNPQDSDCGESSPCWSSEDGFPDEQGWEGWIARSVPVSWIGDGRLDLTVRLWDARVDAAELVVEVAVPTNETSWGAVKSIYR